MKAPDNRQLRIFLCHAHEDKEKVEVLYKQLELFGYDPWIDKKDILPGQEWELIIEKQIDNTDAIIICLSAISSVKIGYIQREIRIALKKSDYYMEQDCFLIPVRLDNCEVPYKLQRFNYIDLYNPNGFSMLLAALNSRAERVGAIQCIYSSYSDLSEDMLIKLVNNSCSDTSVNLFKAICRNIAEKKLAPEILISFNNHPYWLIRKLAIEEIIDLNQPNILDMLFEYKKVSYHVSQSLIREYIQKRIEEDSFKSERC